MTAKEYLSQAYRLDESIQSKLMQVQSYRDLATHTCSVISDTPRSDSPDLQPMAGLVAKIVDKENEINEAIDAFIDLKTEIERAIALVETTDYRLLLELRYLCFRSWGQIATAMRYSARWVHIVHSRALAAIDKVLREGRVRMSYLEALDDGIPKET